MGDKNMFSNNNIILTVLIPTYNRKDNLQNVLLALQRQTAQDFYIVISDNASDYSIENEIYPVLDEGFKRRIQIYKRRNNIGGSANIAGLFSLCETRWGWLLGDDDFVKENAIEIILADIKSNPDTACFWYSVTDKLKIDKELYSLPELTDIVKYTFFGDLIFISNKVFDMNKASRYSEVIYEHTYTHFCQTFPMFELLKHREIVKFTTTKKIVKHNSEETRWNFKGVVQGMRTIMDYNTGLDWKEHLEFVKAASYSYRTILLNYILNDLPWNYREYLKTVYNDTYAQYNGIIKNCFYKIVNCVLSTKYGKKATYKFAMMAKEIKHKRRAHR